MSDSISEWCLDQNPLENFEDVEVPNEAEIIPAVDAVKWTPNYKNRDMRPRVFDKLTKAWTLVDSGSAVTVVQAGADDEVVPGMFLKTVNGQKVECCGRRKVSFQFNRKQYHFNAVVAKIKSTIIGWDFICKYRLNWEWDTWGNIHLVDRKAGIKTLM